AEARVGGHVLLPQDDAGLEVDADGATVIADDVDVVADDRKPGADVDQALELAAAGRVHDRDLPRRITVRNRVGSDAAVVEAADDERTGDARRRVAAQRQVGQVLLDVPDQ